MKEEIEKALEQATPRWHDNGNEIVSLDAPRVGIGGFLKDEDNYLAANAPEWLRWSVERIEQLEKALNEITELGWSERFGGGYQYMGEYHAEAIKIARQALGKEE